MSKVIDPQRTAQKQVETARNRVEDVVKGIEGLVETPGAVANRRIEKYRRGVLEAIDNNRVQEGNNSYSLQDYKDVTIKKVRDRYATGMSDALPKLIAYWQVAGPFQEALSKQIQAMPANTDADMEARLLAARRGMKKFRYKGKRR